MGGLGSGGWNRSRRATVQDTPQLCLASLKRAGVLEPGACRICRWSIAGREIASIGVHGEIAGLRLVYATGSGANRRRVEDRINILSRPCRFGGARPFFCCPRCGAAVLSLYLCSTRFLCRHCADLTYPTQRERGRDRRLRRANKLRRRLGGEEGAFNGAPERPRGMWTRTYQRLAAELERHDQAALEELVDWTTHGRACRRQGAGFWR